MAMLEAQVLEVLDLGGLGKNSTVNRFPTQAIQIHLDR
jgi:hypothetical protein